MLKRTDRMTRGSTEVFAVANNYNPDRSCLRLFNGEVHSVDSNKVPQALIGIE